MAGKGFQEAARALNAAIPAAHKAFLASLQTCVITDSFLFCHAGVRPNVPLNEQTAGDFLWIRDEFLKSEQDYGKMIIHGHSPNEWPEIKRNRINIDTGAFATGRLTCLVIEPAGNGRLLFTA